MTDQISIHTLILLAAALSFTYAAVSDVRDYRIPNTCSIVLALLYAVHVWQAPREIIVGAALIVTFAAFTVCMVFYTMKRLGGGDVKLITVASLWAGPALIADFIVVTALAGGVLSLVYITHFFIAPALGFDHGGARGDHENPLTMKLPYGVAIAAGGLVTLVQLAN
jgi:prepilin peptidase CpaA